MVTVSLDEPDSRDDDDDSPSFADSTRDQAAIDPGEEAARRDGMIQLAREITRLGDRQKLVLALYYQDELTFREIGEVLGVTESRVCQIHTRAIMRLKGKIDRNEGRSSIGQITKQIRRRQEETERVDTEEPVVAGVKTGRREFEPVNVMACLSLFQVASCLAWLARSGNWPT